MPSKTSGSATTTAGCISARAISKRLLKNTTSRLTARDKEAAIAAAKNLPPDCFTWANEYDRMEARPVKDMDAAKDAVQGFVRFEAATSQIYPWAIPEEQILSEPMLTNIAKDLTQREDGSYDTDELYGNIEKFAGINPVLNNKN